MESKSFMNNSGVSKYLYSFIDQETNFSCRVKLLVNATTGEAVAMKVIDLKKHANAAESVKKEVCVHRMLNDPHIIRFYGRRENGNFEFIFLEYAAGGELFDRIGEMFTFLQLVYILSILKHNKNYRA